MNTTTTTSTTTVTDKATEQKCARRADRRLIRVALDQVDQLSRQGFDLGMQHPENSMRRAFWYGYHRHVGCIQKDLADAWYTTSRDRGIYLARARQFHEQYRDECSRPFRYNPMLERFSEAYTPPIQHAVYLGKRKAWRETGAILDTLHR